MENPDELTKEQLKDELLAHGVQLSSRMRKSQYVELYHSHITCKKAESRTNETAHASSRKTNSSNASSKNTSSSNASSIKTKSSKSMRRVELLRHQAEAAEEQEAIERKKAALEEEEKRMKIEAEAAQAEAAREIRQAGVDRQRKELDLSLRTLEAKRVAKAEFLEARSSKARSDRTSVISGSMKSSRLRGPSLVLQGPSPNPMKSTFFDAKPRTINQHIPLFQPAVNDPRRSSRTFVKIQPKQLCEDTVVPKPSTSDAPVRNMPSSGQQQLMELGKVAQGMSKSIAHSMLPRRQIQSFSGDPLNYYQFVANFESNFKNIEDWDVKLNYLLQYCSGKAYEVIKSCIFIKSSEKAYRTAREKLEEKFGKTHSITDAFLTQITDGSQLKDDDLESLDRLATDMENCRITLEEWRQGHRLDSPEVLGKLFDRLPGNLQAKIHERSASLYANNIDPDFSFMLDFISQRLKMAETRWGRKILFKSNGRNNQQSPTKRSKPLLGKISTFATRDVSTQSVTNALVSKTCSLCAGQHCLAWCNAFKEKSVEQRKKFAKEQRLCYNCLRNNHTVRECSNAGVCRMPGCGKKHHTLLHSSSHQSLARDGAGTSQVMSGGTTNCTKLRNVRLKVVPVTVWGPQGDRSTNTYAFLDEGSDTSLCSESLQKRLNVVGEKGSVSINTVNGAKIQHSSRVSLRVRGYDGMNTYELNDVLSIPQLPSLAGSIPTPYDCTKYEHLKGVKFPVSKSSMVELLIGACDPQIHQQQEVRSGSQGQPIAIKTGLGWTLFGPEAVNQNCNSDRSCSINFIKRDELLHQQLNQMYQHDFVDGADSHGVSPSLDDRRASLIMETTLQRSGDQYQVGLPWKSDKVCLPFNRSMAESRLSSLKRRFTKDPNLHRSYCEKIELYLSRSYARRIPKEELPPSNKTWYVPHHATGPKFRVVFDCAAKYKGVSLNQQLLTGPDHTNNLLGVLTRFRQQPVAFLADIEGMFHQVKVAPDDCDALRFLWWPDGNLEEDPVDHQMLVHLFGAVSSPSCAGFALRQVATSNAARDNEAVVNTILKNFYVDDCLKSLESQEETIALIKQLKAVLKSGGFNLTKFLSNDKDVLASIPIEDRTNSVVSLDLDKLPIERALGVVWNTEVDQFEFRVKIRQKPCTRRGILSMISQVFDPLGFIQPFVLPMKKLMQQLCDQKIPWDDVIPQEQRLLWTEWLSRLPALEELAIPRCFKSSSRIASLQLHCFSDASMVGYGAVAYLRFLYADGNVQCSFVLGKSRVTPKKTTTIPRLELTAAVVACKLKRFVTAEAEYTIDEIYLWTDSTTVLQYINNTSTRFHTFVGNRLAIIHSDSELHQWRYVDTATNPADFASRGASPDRLMKAHRWLRGPEFLLREEESWPAMPSGIACIPGDDPEVKVEVRVCSSSVTSDVNDPLKELLRRYSSWNKLVRGVCWLLRFKRWLLNRKRMDNSSDNLTVTERDNAVLTIVKLIQREEFQEAIAKLKNHDRFEDEFSLTPKRRMNKCKYLHPLRKLSPIVVNGVLRVGGRLQKSDLPDDTKHQIILPRNNHVTNLIIEHYHCKEGHCGPLHVHAAVREKFWIMKGQSAVRSAIRNCLKCRIQKAKTAGQIMAPLPSERTTAGNPPFTFVGIDYMGPLTVKRARSRVKRYGCIFTCLATRAIHIEVAHALDTNAFLHAFHRFIARRGSPSKVFSDNGTNFVGAERELREGVERWNQSYIHNDLYQKGIEWHFNPPNASHRGGVWERMIRSVRKIIASIAGNQLLDDDALHTFMLEVERILNNRPITPLSDDPEDTSCLTPNSILLGRLHASLPPDEFTQADGYRKSWKAVQHMSDLFWRKWLREYLPLLQSRQKWTYQKPNINVGDVVLMSDDNCRRGQWPKAVVEETFPDQFGVVRTVRVRTSTGTYLRDIRKLCLLEGIK